MGLPLSYLTGIAHTNMTKYTKEGNHPVEADEDYYTGDYSDPDDSSKSEKSSDSSSGDAPIECYCDETSCRFVSGIWLTCTQWGYSESTNYGYNIFESSLPVNHGLDLCADIFGEEFNRTSVEGVSRTSLHVWRQSKLQG
uniref:Uncharacterized protein n=1 Tax=Ditylenchus dipsaci TaxID=166011 RepID=A0A915CSY5_9BILA